MSLFWKIAFFYLVMINLMAIVLTIADKHRAKKHLWRVPEHTLLTASVLGGSVCMLLTMLLIRHKTRKPKFMVGIPVILLLQMVFAYACWTWGWFTSWT